MTFSKNRFGLDQINKQHVINEIDVEFFIFKKKKLSDKKLKVDQNTPLYTQIDLRNIQLFLIKGYGR